MIPWNRSKRFKRMKWERRGSCKMLSWSGQLELTSTGPLRKAMWVWFSLEGHRSGHLHMGLHPPMHTSFQVVHVGARLVQDTLGQDARALQWRGEVLLYCPCVQLAIAVKDGAKMDQQDVRRGPMHKENCQWVSQATRERHFTLYSRAWARLIKVTETQILPLSTSPVQISDGR